VAQADTQTDPSRDARIEEAMRFFDQYLKRKANAPGGKERTRCAFGEEKRRTTK
jgi:hypothetical protein